MEHYAFEIMIGLTSAFSSAILILVGVVYRDLKGRLDRINGTLYKHDDKLDKHSIDIMQQKERFSAHTVSAQELSAAVEKITARLEQMTLHCALMHSQEIQEDGRP